MINLFENLRFYLNTQVPTCQPLWNYDDKLHQRFTRVFNTGKSLEGCPSQEVIFN